MLKSLNQKLAAQHMTLQVTDNALAYIRDVSYSPTFGARPTKRYIERTLETDIAKRIIKGDLTPHQTIVIDAKDTLVYTIKNS
jgi:ATP-dependent Clp protease ATP-binding subunit ClpB